MMAEAMMIVVNIAALTTMMANGIGALSGTWYSASPTYNSRGINVINNCIQSMLLKIE
jgi:hypothetical protein